MPEFLLIFLSHVNALFTNTYDERICNALLLIEHCKVRVLGVLQPTLSRNESQANLVLVKFLKHNLKTIEYLQLCPYFLTTVLAPLLIQLQCTNLRVLSIDSCDNLEFFEWSEVINLHTTGIMALYQLLSSGHLCVMMSASRLAPTETVPQHSYAIYSPGLAITESTINIIVLQQYNYSTHTNITFIMVVALGAVVVHHAHIQCHNNNFVILE